MSAEEIHHIRVQTELTEEEARSALNAQQGDVNNTIRVYFGLPPLVRNKTVSKEHQQQAMFSQFRRKLYTTNEPTIMEPATPNLRFPEEVNPN